MKRLALCLLVALLLLSSLAPLASAGEAWKKELGSEITAVATDERGDLIFVGTESGLVYCYDSGGGVVWSRQLLAEPVQKILSSDDGDTVAAQQPSRASYIDGNTGTPLWIRPATIRDIALSRDGSVLCAVESNYRILFTRPGVYADLDIGSWTNCAISGKGDWLVTGSGSILSLTATSIPQNNWYQEDSRGWEKRASHTIVGSPDGALTNYPVEIQVVRGTGTTSGNTIYVPDCRPTFYDIRFTSADGSTLLPHHLAAINGNTATFIVNVPAIPASPGTATIYVYWSDSFGAGSDVSNPKSVYEFYDDFEDGSIDPLWTVSADAGGIVQETGGYLELKSPAGVGENGALAISPTTYGSACMRINATVFSTYDSTNLNRHRFFYESTYPGIFDTPEAPAMQLYWPSTTGKLASLDAPVQHTIYVNSSTVQWVAGSDWDVTKPGGAPGAQIRLETGEPGQSSYRGHMRIYEVAIQKWTTNEPTHGAWGSVESTSTPLDTKTLNGTIIDIDAPETGDWVAVSTTTKTYIIQITDSGFGTVYSADRTGTPYQIQVADGGSFAIEGRNILADIFRIDGVQVGTYTTGGAVRHVTIAQKNGLYAAAGSDDGKLYIFSKDAASSWYLLHASDSDDPVTAIAMSWRGELLIVGRADGRLTAFQVSEQDATGSVKLTVFKDNKPYAAAPLHIEDGGTNQEWSAPITVTTDDYGVAVVPVQWGHYLRITAGDDELSRVLVATPSQAEYVLRIKGPAPLRTGAQYASSYDPNTQRIYLSYDDTRQKTHRVVYQIVRSSDNTVVFEREYTDADLPLTDYYQIPADWTNTSYRVHLTASGSPSFTNTWSQWVGVDGGVAKLPAELDNYMKMGICFFLLLFVAGLFSYLTGPQGAVVVSMLAGALVLWGWLPLPPTIIALCIVWAFLGLLGRTSGE